MIMYFINCFLMIIGSFCDGQLKNMSSFPVISMSINEIGEKRYKIGCTGSGGG